MASPRPIVEQAKCDLPKIAVLGAAFLALDRAGLKLESRDDGFGIIRARPDERFGVAGSLIVRAWDSPPGSEMEFLVEVASLAERERADELMRAFIAAIQPSLRGFRLLEQITQEPVASIGVQRRVTAPARPNASTREQGKRIAAIAAMVLGILGGLIGLMISGSVGLLVGVAVTIRSPMDQSLVIRTVAAFLCSGAGIGGGAISLWRPKIAGGLMLIAAVGGFVSMGILAIWSTPLLLIGGILAIVSDR